MELGTLVQGISQAHLDRVTRALMERDSVRLRRSIAANCVDPVTYIERLDALRVRMADARRRTPAGRGGPFAMLDEAELGLLERAIAVHEHSGRFVHCNDDRDFTEHLAPLRLNYLCGADALSGVQFRDIARTLYARLIELALTIARPDACLERTSVTARQLVAVLPWRAALIAGEACYDLGCRTFWHYGCSRDEETLQSAIYHESAAAVETRGATHLILDPMLASAATLMHVIERLTASGVSTWNMVIVSAIAAPEGVDRILHTYPEIRIIAAALDGNLDRRGYIAMPGLGDFGDLAMRGVDMAYAEEHWTQRGLLTRSQAEIVLARTT